MEQRAHLPFQHHEAQLEHRRKSRHLEVLHPKIHDEVRLKSLHVLHKSQSHHGHPHVVVLVLPEQDCHRRVGKMALEAWNWPALLAVT